MAATYQLSEAIRACERLRDSGAAFRPGVRSGATDVCVSPATPRKPAVCVNELET